MTDEKKIERIIESVREKLKEPQVPNNVNGKLIVELKEGGAMDKRIEAKL